MTASPPDHSTAAAEARLVERARAGDPGAYGELVAMHQAAAFRLAFVLLGSAADAEDAAQEGFVRAHLALARFRTGEPFRPWLLAIVGNEARNRRRSRTRREGVFARAVAAFRGSPGDIGGGPDSAVLAVETRVEVRAALATLDDGERLVVTCRYLLDLSEAETAAALGIPAGTVKSRLHRALRRLRERLGPAMEASA